jgi:hypothetical protein
MAANPTAPTRAMVPDTDIAKLGAATVAP